MANKIYVGQEGAQELYRRVKALSANFATAEQGAKADAAYQKPVDGIPKSDLDSGVQASLGKADTALQEHQDISGKVDKVEGKGLSTNDFTDNDKDKLDGIATGAQVNVIEKVQVNGTALSVSDKTVNIQLASGNTAGVVTGEERATWNSWLSGDHSIPVSGVNIGGRTYSIVKINNRIWMAENLAYNVAGKSADSATASYGKLYSRDALSQIPIPSGWRIPNESDVLDLCGSSSASAPYRATTWSNGTNTTGFTAQPSGYIDNGTTYSSSCALWASKSEGIMQYYIEIGTNQIRYVHGGAAYNYWMGIRLVRNV